MQKAPPSHPASSRLLKSQLFTLFPTALSLALPVALVTALPAQAVSFRFDFADNVSDDFKSATQDAADAWSAQIKDDVVVDLRIEYSDLSGVGPVLGGIIPGRTTVKYKDYVKALLLDSVSSNDYRGLSNLQLSSKGYEAVQSFQNGRSQEADLDSKEFSFLMDSKFSYGRSRVDFIDGNGNNNNKYVTITNAQSKALGLSDAYGRGVDGVVKLNSSVGWDLDRSNGVDSDKYDLSTVLQHEIGHALGFISGSDSLDFLASSSAPTNAEENEFSYLTPMDFYRYSQESERLGVSDLTLGSNAKYFSLDGGQSAVTDEGGRQALFSTGSKSVGGDGFQGSHWKADGNSPLGIMTPLLSKGQAVDISQLDLTLLDVVGWDLEDSNAEKAAAVGLNWTGLTEGLARDRQSVKDSITAQWQGDIPELDSALSDAAIDLESDFREDFQKEFDKLIGKLSKGKDSNKEIDKFYKKAADLADKRNDKLRKLPEDIYKTDSKIRKWLRSSTDELSDKMKKADGATINRLSNIVKAAPDSERAELEPKLKAALQAFSDRPDKVLQQLLDTKGPVNPVSWGSVYSFWWWGMEAADERDPLLYAATAAEGFSALPSVEQAAAIDSFEAYYATANKGGEAQDIPEPASVLALFGIAVLGVGMRRKRERG